MRLLIPLIVAVAAIVAFGTHSEQPAVAAGCGPAMHWIDTCPAGTDSMANTGALVGVDVNFDCVKDFNLVLYGPVDVERQAPSDVSTNIPGASLPDAHLDTIDTEIVSMELIGPGGVTLRVGTTTPGIHPAVPATLGTVVEVPNDSTKANSFFDVFFEVELPGPQKFYNHAPLRIASLIDRVPPVAKYLHPTGLCLPLYDSPTGGTHGANLVQAVHDTTGNPPSLPIGGLVEIPVSSDSSGEAPFALGLLGVGTVALLGAWFAGRRIYRAP